MPVVLGKEVDELRTISENRQTTISIKLLHCVECNSGNAGH